MYSSSGSDDSNQDRVHLVVQHQYLNASGNWLDYPDPTTDGNPYTHPPAREDFYSVKCHTAHCQINSVIGEMPGGQVAWGNGYSGKYTVYATVYNDGGGDASELPPSLSGHALSLTDANGKHYISATIHRSASIPFSYSGSVSDTGHPQTITINASPEYVGGPSLLGAVCPPFSFGVYVPFNLSIDADTKLEKDGRPDDEDPNNVKYFSSVTNNSSDNVTISTRSCFYKLPASCGSGAIAGPVNGGTYGADPTDLLRGNYDPRPFNPGDKYCTYMYVQYTFGWVGPGGDVQGGGGEKSLNPCKQVVNMPYTHFLGSDVSAGGGFKDSTGLCTTDHGGIKTYTKTTGSQPIGSGVQIGALS
ncbi:hypothetical protein COY17_03675, partial [Candidatus Saccharibacteria bacterium CG_4_10_14_0_2_um_filter_52_9]